MSDNVIRAAQRFGVEQGGPEGAPGASYTSGGGGPYDPGMEARVQALEANIASLTQAMARVEATTTQTAKDLRDLREKDVTDLKVKLAGLEGRVGAMPTTLQLILFVIAVLAFGLGRQFFGG